MLNKSFLLGVVFTVLLVGVPSIIAVAQVWNGSNLVDTPAYDFLLTAQEKAYITANYPLVNRIYERSGKTIFTIDLAKQNADLDKAEQFFKALDDRKPRRNLDGTVEDCKTEFSATLNKRIYTCTTR